METILQNIKKSQQYTEYTKTFVKHLEDAINTYYKPHLKEDKKYYCCSDIIESFLGKYKEQLADNPHVGIASQCLEIPLYTKSQNQILRHLQEAIKTISIKKIKQWKQENISENKQVKRNQFFKKEQKSEKQLEEL